MLVQRRIYRFACLTLASWGLLTHSIRSADATTLAYWRFQGDGTTIPAVGDQVEDTNGRNIGVTFPNAPGVAVLDSSGNGNTLRAWDHPFAGHTYQADVPSAPLKSGLPNTLSVQNAGSFPAMFTWSLKSAPTVDVEPIKPLAWTIEASIKQTATTGFHNTFVGRDGNDDIGASPAAPLYFKTEGGVLRILFRDEAGNFYNLGDPTGALTLNTWYNVAAVSDGTTLSLYKGSGVGGYTLVNSMALTPGDTRLSYDDNGSTTAGDTQWGWTVGRGRFGTSDAQADNHVDRWLGSIDEVRISDSALTPAQFLYVSAPMQLIVNKVTGAVAIRNTGTTAITFDYYQITSPDADGPGGAPGGALNKSSWNSLSDQNVDAGLSTDFDNNNSVGASDLTVWRNSFGSNANADADSDGDSDGADFLKWQRTVGQTPGPGDSWDEAELSSNLVLAELFLNGATTLNPGQQVSLGNAFNPAVFGSGVDANLSFTFGIQGDNSQTQGNVQYVTTGPAVAVPEPAAIMLTVCGIVVLAGRARRMMHG